MEGDLQVQDVMEESSRMAKEGEEEGAGLPLQMDLNVSNDQTLLNVRVSVCRLTHTV